MKRSMVLIVFGGLIVGLAAFSIGKLIYFEHSAKTTTSTTHSDYLQATSSTFRDEDGMQFTYLNVTVVLPPEGITITCKQIGEDLKCKTVRL
jgi:hypothetical protein